MKKKKASASSKRKPVKKPAPGKKAARRRVPAKSASRRKRTSVPPARGAKIPLIGVISHYFPRVQAAVIDIKVPLSVGDKVKIKGATTDFEQGVQSMQLDHKPIDKASKGDVIGLLVNSRVREGDLVYKPKPVKP